MQIVAAYYEIPAVSGRTMAPKTLLIAASF